MALTIDNATDGYDPAGVDGLLQRIQIEVINEATLQMETKRKNLNDTLDDIWQGKSEKIFKSNMKYHIEIAKKSMEDAYDSMKTSVYQIIGRMYEVDQNLVKEEAA